MGDSWAQMQVVYKSVPLLKPDENTALRIGLSVTSDDASKGHSYTV
jgi:hypothetical protein